MRKMFLMMVICSGFALSNCGGGSEGTGSSILGSVDGSKPINELIESEKSIICENIKKNSREIIYGPNRCNELAATEPDYYMPDSYIEGSPITREEWSALCEGAKKQCLLVDVDDPNYVTPCDKLPESKKCILDESTFSGECNLPVELLANCVQELIDEHLNSNAAFTCDAGYDERIYNIPVIDGLSKKLNCEKINSQCRDFMTSDSKNGGIYFDRCYVLFESQIE